MAEQERGQVGAFDRFEPHGLSPAELDIVAGTLAPHPAVVQAYLVERHLRHSTGQHRVLGIVTKGSAGPELTAALRARLLDDDVMIVMLTRQDLSLKAALAAVPRACIYDRSQQVV